MVETVERSSIITISRRETMHVPNSFRLVYDELNSPCAYIDHWHAFLSRGTALTHDEQPQLYIMRTGSKNSYLRGETQVATPAILLPFDYQQKLNVPGQISDFATDLTYRTAKHYAQHLIRSLDHLTTIDDQTNMPTFPLHLLGDEFQTRIEKLFSKQ